ncbi:MAG: transcriptional regulator, partial [Actinobacteria bacterium]|nr:transcriptional regulator [Actinomycetota bacterium]
QVRYAWTAFQNAHWPLLGQVLPRLLTAAQLAATAYPGTGEQARRARILLSQTYQVSASTLWKLKEPDLAWLAAERGLVLAEETGDSLLISDAARRVVHGLMVMSHHEQALALVRADIDRLEPGRGAGSSVYLSLYGMLFLMGAVVAARASNHAAARELLAEGHEVARQLGYDGNECFTAFGPTNVHLHQVAVLLDLGDGVGAIEASGYVTPDGLNRLPKERRANFYLDVASGYSLSGQRDEAVRTLLTADRLSPDEIRCRPPAIDLIEHLRRSVSGTYARDLSQLAARVGLTDHG